MMEQTILWADDEMDLLKPHLLFLAEKGYKVITANNGQDAVELLKKNDVDIVLLDENMPGISGLETLSIMKNLHPQIPIVMITKSEEESIMEDAIGSKIADYLIKPVNPKQILSSIKKHLDGRQLISEKTNTGYQQDFRNIGMTLSDRLDFEQWKEVYRKIMHWELEIAKSDDKSMQEILKSQRDEANRAFSKYIEKSYLNWLNGVADDTPSMSHTLIKNKILPTVDKEACSFVLVIDNLRYDQWKVIQPIVSQYFKIDEDEIYAAILPTATQYARNALFAGLMPSEIAKRYPQYWVNDEEEGGKNLHEEALLMEQLKRLGKQYKVSYNKITNIAAGKKLVDNMPNLMQNKLNVIVYNFIDMLSHARTEMEIIRELAEDETAYRSLTLSWFEHSPLLEMMKFIAEKNCKMFITTDHGTVHVTEPVKIVGDKNTNSNLRYKTGKSLDYNKKEVFEIKNPNDAYLPKQHVSSAFVFAKENSFFAYPNNYNHYVSYYRNTFQHGGVSLEEMMIPIISLSPKNS
jgi:CheY-like chemotaxis protein